MDIYIWTGKVIIKWNHYKSVQATIDSMFVNEKIFRILSSLIIKNILWQKPGTPPPNPLKCSAVGGGGLNWGKRLWIKLVLLYYLKVIWKGWGTVDLNFFSSRGRLCGALLGLCFTKWRGSVSPPFWGVLCSFFSWLLDRRFSSYRIHRLKLYFQNLNDDL